MSVRIKFQEFDESQAWWCTDTFSTPRRLGQEDYCKFNANLGYVVRPTDILRHVWPQSRVSEERKVCMWRGDECSSRWVRNQ